MRKKRRKKRGVQPDARAAKLVSEVAEMLGPERAECEVHIRMLFSEPPQPIGEPR